MVGTVPLFRNGKGDSPTIPAAGPAAFEPLATFRAYDPDRPALFADQWSDPLKGDLFRACGVSGAPGRMESQLPRVCF